MTEAKKKPLKKPVAKKPSAKKSPAKKTRPRPGQPTKYTEKLGDEICEALIRNPLIGLAKICKLPEYSHFPNPDSIYVWRHKEHEFSDKYLKAARTKSELAVEEAESFYDDALYYFDSDGNKRIDSPSVALATAKANSKKWFASRLAPKLYGDKKQLDEVKDENEGLKKELQNLRRQLQEQNESEY